MANKKQINVNVTEEIYDKIVVMAKEDVRTLSNMGELLILYGLKYLEEAEE